MSAQHNDLNTLEDLAADLRSLANDLDQRKLRVGSRHVAIGNPLFIKTKQKISGDTAYCTLSFQVPLGDSDKEDPRASDQRPSPEKNHETQHDKGLRLKGRPPEGKKIKKEISGLWKTVSKKLEQGQPPAPAEEKALIAALENYTVFSEPPWHDDWLACCKVLRDALESARRGDMHSAMQYATQVTALTKACHQKYK